MLAAWVVELENFQKFNINYRKLQNYYLSGFLRSLEQPSTAQWSPPPIYIFRDTVGLDNTEQNLYNLQKVTLPRASIKANAPFSTHTPLRNKFIQYGVQYP